MTALLVRKPAPKTSGSHSRPCQHCNRKVGELCPELLAAQQASQAARKRRRQGLVVLRRTGVFSGA